MTPRFTYSCSRWHSDLGLWVFGDSARQSLVVGMVADTALFSGKYTRPEGEPLVAGLSMSKADTETDRGRWVPSEVVKSSAAGLKACTVLLEETACFGMFRMLAGLPALVLVAADQLGGREKVPYEVDGHSDQLSS